MISQANPLRPLNGNSVFIGRKIQDHPDAMRLALEMAHLSEQQGEVPVGAILVQEEKVIAEGCNTPITSHDPSAHAEILTLRSAGSMLHNYRFLNCTLYVTLEPCLMCMGAIFHARIPRLIFGAFDEKAGAVISRLSLETLNVMNAKLKWQGGILADESISLLRNFFKIKRKEAKRGEI